MELWQIGCLGAIILFVGVFIGLLIIGKKAQELGKKIIADLNRDGWQIIENSKDNVNVKEWVKTELQSDPERYTVFGPLVETYFSGWISRESLSFNQLWNKQEGDKHYFILDVSDKYQEPRQRGYGYSSVNFTIFGMRTRQLSLPFFTLFPRMKFPKKRGWRHSISETHGLNLSNRINESAKEFKEDLAIDYRIKQPLKLPSILPDEPPPPPKTDPPITFGSRPFDERYELYGKETERLRQFFDNEKLTALESLPQTFVDAGGELIFVYIPEHKPSIEDIEKYINDGIAIINVVCREPDRVA